MKKTILLLIFTLSSSIASAQLTATVDTTISFGASPDHNVINGTTNVVSSYLIKVLPQGNSTPVFTRNIGKPTPNGSNVIAGISIGWTANQFGAITGGNYVLIVSTIGPGNTNGVDNTPSDVFIIPSSQRVNVALASNGATASASSIYTSDFPASSTINGDRKGIPWGTSGGWNDSTPDTYPDWVEVDFSSSKTISEIDVFTLQDNYASPVDPTLSTTFTLYGITGFEVQYWNGSAWTNLAMVTNNNLVWKQFMFTAVTTTKIRINVTSSLLSYSRITEIEAWTN